MNYLGLDLRQPTVGYALFNVRKDAGSAMIHGATTLDDLPRLLVDVDRVFVTTTGAPRSHDALRSAARAAGVPVEAIGTREIAKATTGRRDAPRRDLARQADMWGYTGAPGDAALGAICVVRCGFEHQAEEV